MDRNKTMRNCVFCKYWDGVRAERSAPDGVYVYVLKEGTCLKESRSGVLSCHTCGYFELNKELYE